MSQLLSLANPLPPWGLAAGLLAGPGPSSINQNVAAASGPAAALGPAAEPGQASVHSSSAAAVTLLANRNSATQGSVINGEVYKGNSTLLAGSSNCPETSGGYVNG